MLKIGCLFILLLAFNANAATLNVSSDEVFGSLREEFVNQGVDEEIDIEVYGGRTNFIIENKKEAKILVSGLKLDEVQNKFYCNVEVFADGELAEKTQLQGKYYIVSDAYVPAVNINKGEVITEAMLRKIRVRTNRVKPMNIIDKDKIIGKEAKRALKEGKLLNERDIGDKIIIKKGEVVNMIYQTGNMQISARVEALSDGSKGDKIEVMNTKSKKVLFAEVVDANTVKTDAGF
jgi:flagella basal body P-ring formation protein FlgA